MTLRLHVAGPLVAGTDIALPAGAARHAQVRRVQPGDALALFNGDGHDWPATVLAVGRSQVQVRLGQPVGVTTELPLALTLAVGMPANERMDLLVEKATELGVAHIQPLLTERSVLRLTGERADRKQAHWQAIAQAACEQCGRARVPQVAPVLALDRWLAVLRDAAAPGRRWVLSLQRDAQPLAALAPGPGVDVAGVAAGAVGAASAATPGAPAAIAGMAPITTLSGPEGGLSPDEEAAARACGFAPVTLGPRVLRADTAPLAVLAWLALSLPRPKSG